jgi:hypothetical protein
MRSIGRLFQVILVVLVLGGLSFTGFTSRTHAAAGVPLAFSYQGRLFDSSGNLLGGSGTTYCFKFSIWNSPTVGAGSRIWPTGAPAAAELSVKNGVFSANIGIDTPDALTFNFYDNDTTYLQIEVAAYSGSCGSYETLSPRQRIAASGYAINSKFLQGATPGTGADNLLKLDGSGNVSLSGTDPSVRATTTNTLTLQGGGVTGDILFYSSANKITSAGVLTISGASSFGSSITLGTSNSADGTLVFKNAGGSNTVTLQTPTIGTSYTLKFPTVQGGASTYLKNDGSGNLSWQSAASSCSNCPLNDSAASDGTNTIAPTTDSTSLTLRQTSAGSPTKNIFAVTNSGNTATYFKIDQVGGMALAPAAGQDAALGLGAGSKLAISASAAPTTSLVSISNAGQATTTANANGLIINYVGGAAAVEGAGLRVDVAPGSTSGGTWSGMRIVANATGAASGVTEYGLKVEGPSSPGSGTEVGLSVGTGWDIGLSLASGGIQMAALSSDPSAPATGNLRLWAKKVVNRNTLTTRDENGNAPHSLQNALYDSSICIIATGSGSNLTNLGCEASSQGTVSHPAPGQTTAYMANFASAASTNAAAGTSSGTPSYFRGNVAGANGYFYYARGYLSNTLDKYADVSTGSRVFFGMTDQTLANAVASDDPSGNRSGFSMVPSRDTSAFNWQFVTKDGSTEHVTDTGVTLEVDKIYDFYIYVPKQGTTIYWEIQNLTDSTSASGTATNNLPIGFVAMRVAAGVGTLEAAVYEVRVQKLYVESDK